ncbi:MAG: hypothetical protein KC731_06660 [Myxococcales bacterium]|nr:hypothetical protein [Myxococcales bacterium]
MQRDAYEFSDRENATIGKAATWSMALAGVSFVMVLVHLIFAIVGTDFDGTSATLLIFDMGAGLVAASCYLAAGVLFAVVGGALRRVVTTEGSDLQNMLKALDTLHWIFVVRIALVFVTVLAVVAVIAVGEGL